MMKMFIKTLKAKKDKTEAEQVMVKMISSSYDISDKTYIEIPEHLCYDLNEKTVKAELFY